MTQIRVIWKIIVNLEANLLLLNLPIICDFRFMVLTEITETEVAKVATEER